MSNSGKRTFSSSVSLGRQFDFIDTSGVLHHLADPWSGWRILLSLLRPGGPMQVGLYSELARRNVVAARALIAERRLSAQCQRISDAVGKTSCAGKDRMLEIGGRAG